MVTRFLKIARLPVHRVTRGTRDLRAAAQLEAHGELVRGGLGHAALLAVHVAADAEQVLDVVPDLVGDHVGLGEVAGGAELLGQRVEEAQVDVHLVVPRAVEGPDGRVLGAAGRVHRVGEQDHPRLLVRAPHRAREQLVPDVLGVRQDRRGELAGLDLLGGQLAHLARLGRTGRGLVLLRGRDLAEQGHRVVAREQAQHHDQDHAQAAADGGLAAQAAGGPAIIDVVALATILPAHAFLESSPCGAYGSWLGGRQLRGPHPSYTTRSCPKRQPGRTTERSRNRVASADGSWTYRR